MIGLKAVSEDSIWTVMDLSTVQFIFVVRNSYDFFLQLFFFWFHNCIECLQSCFKHYQCSGFILSSPLNCTTFVFSLYELTN